MNSKSRLATNVPKNILDILWKAKESYREMIINGRFSSKKGLTWYFFIEQSVMALQALYFLPSIKAIRYNQYIYEATCPNCSKLSEALHRGKNLMWRIKCSSCGTEYIAMS